MRPWRDFGKRLFDLFVAIFLLLLFSPLLIVLALLVRLKLDAPVLFEQDRPGRGEKIFPMLKFRTMTDARDASGVPLPDEQRLTPFGAFLRGTSLDELPELFNVRRAAFGMLLRLGRPACRKSVEQRTRLCVGQT